MEFVIFMLFVIAIGSVVFFAMNKHSKDDAGQRDSVSTKQHNPKISEHSTVVKSLPKEALVQNSHFTRKQILQKAEYRVFAIVKDMVSKSQPKFLVCPQVSLGEVLGNKDETAYNAIKCKRCDILVVDNCGYPVIAIEYHGKAHYQQSDDSSRDAIKAAALNSAGVKLLVVYSGFDAEILRKDIHNALLQIHRE